MGLVKTKKTILLIISLMVGFLSGCVPNIPAFLSETDVEEVYRILDKYYYKPLDFDIDTFSTVDDLLEHLDDPYTYLYKPDTRSINMGDVYQGIGISIIDHELGMLISEVNEYADIDDKIYVGDIIIKVNDEALEGLSFDEKSLRLKGSLDEFFDLTILRGDQTITTTVIVKSIPIASVTYKTHGSVGYIDINRFAVDTSESFQRILDKLEENTLSGLVIDVRDNGGGYLNAVVGILRQFMSESDQAFVTMHRVFDNKFEPYLPIDGTVRKPYPIVILVNDNSASASEVLAAAMQEQENYKLIGTRTYGKDVYQVSFRLDKLEGGYYLNMTEGYWYTPLDHRVTGGILPDILKNPHPLFTYDYPMYQNEKTLGSSIEGYEAIIQTLILKTESDLTIPQNLILNEAITALIATYQTENDLTRSETLNYETTLSLIDDYNALKQSTVLDLQLIEALAYIGNYDSSIN